MRLFTASLAVVAALLIASACNSKSSSSSTDQTNAAASSAAETSPEASAAGATATTAAAGEVPSYPGAVTQASGSSSNMGSSAAGKVMTTDDSFDKVYQWYQQNMPAGSEKSHTTSPMNSAVFTLGEPGKGQTSVTITTQGSKTMITVAHVKM
jgi:hypothetical protein